MTHETLPAVSVETVWRRSSGMDRKTGLHLHEAIRKEVARRRLHWIAGVPTPADLEAVLKHVAHAEKQPLDDVRACLVSLQITVVP